MATDKLFHQYSILFGESLLRLLDVEDYTDYKAFSFTVKEIERRSDVIFENKRGKERAIWIEFQGYRDEQVFYRLNIAMTLYCQQREFFGELLPIVVFLKRSYYNSARPLEYHFDERSYLKFNPVVYVFDKKSIQELKKLNDVRLIPLYPLCDISPKRIMAQAPSWVEKIKQEKQLSPIERTNIVALLGGFISHRIKKMTLKDINQLLGGFKMEETQVGKDLIEIGIEKGIEKGIEQGFEQGIEQGFEQGIEQGIEKGIEKGIEQGIEKGKQLTLLNLLSYKFGEIPNDIKNQINSLSDVTKLDDLATKILDLTDLDELKKILN